MRSLFFRNFKIIQAMSDYISIADFNRNWNFFMRKVGRFSSAFKCSLFSCSGCDDWLDAESPNRNFRISFSYLK